jgi:putative transposase
MSFNLPPPPGFQGLRPDVAVECYQRHLPHWRQAGATYFLTFRLADSIPQEKLELLRLLRLDWERKHRPPFKDEQWQELWRETFRRVDRWLDQGMGGCCLKERQASAIVAEALQHFDNERYELDCYVIMPNHVHVAVRPFEEDKEALARITHSWKRHTSREINLCLGRDGTLWEDESYDRIIRDAEHLWRVVQYIGDNPARGNSSKEICPTWIRPEWELLGWRFAS